ncbi:uncharacterized protein BCR38DRAFT_243345 [Pseudomassariella vexata]|uniref:Uncharacterized protein n=1 Tax=Pseudomassariella vexata TaxID=1141098 RepID=A0A1Y2DTK1_9PEZI|nr:uncharacterized protein BCR38DRAFT_243345 [Pseudomassariella vexata]ORY62590.1 hypothetical protein BCR38DRAFT_243345 [Pseudomassariella vexata]
MFDSKPPLNFRISIISEVDPFDGKVFRHVARWGLFAVVAQIGATKTSLLMTTLKCLLLARWSCFGLFLVFDASSVDRSYSSFYDILFVVSWAVNFGFSESGLLKPSNRRTTFCNGSTISLKSGGILPSGCGMCYRTGSSLRSFFASADFDFLFLNTSQNNKPPKRRTWC